MRDKGIRAINETVKEKWDERLPLESVFHRITHCRTIAFATIPVSDRAAVLNVLGIMTQAGHFTDAIKEWNGKPLSDNSHANSETHFPAAEEEHQETTATGQAGHHTTNNAATEATTNPNTSAVGGTSERLPWLHTNQSILSQQSVI
jgi:hypothetical protein